jgi:hypothetical protein
LKNLPYGAGEEEVKAFLSAAGPVGRVELVRDALGQPRGLARVRMETSDGAASAVETLSGASLQGRSVSLALDSRSSRHCSTTTADGDGGGRGRTSHASSHTREDFESRD